MTINVARIRRRWQPLGVLACAGVIRSGASGWVQSVDGLGAKEAGGEALVTEGGTRSQWSQGWGFQAFT